MCTDTPHGPTPLHCKFALMWGGSEKSHPPKSHLLWGILLGHAGASPSLDNCSLFSDVGGGRGESVLEEGGISLLEAVDSQGEKRKNQYHDSTECTWIL